MSLGFYVDLASCIGCKTCQVACKDRRDSQVAGPRLRPFGIEDHELVSISV